MWIIITKKLPVSKEYRPNPLDIYWATPWNRERGNIEEALLKLDDETFSEITGRRVIKDPEKRPYIATRYSKRILKNSDILFDKEIKNQMWDIIEAYKEFPSYFEEHGYTPNVYGKMRIMVNNQAVGIFPHEFNVVTKENMEAYLKESHKLIISDVAREIFETFDDEQKLIKEAAMLDGCDSEQASRVAIGKSVEFDFPLPIGYYECNENLRNIFF